MSIGASAVFPVPGTTGAIPLAFFVARPAGVSNGRLAAWPVPDERPFLLYVIMGDKRAFEGATPVKVVAEPTSGGSVRDGRLGCAS